MPLVFFFIFITAVMLLNWCIGVWKRKRERERERQSDNTEHCVFMLPRWFDDDVLIGETHFDHLPQTPCVFSYNIQQADPSHAY